MRPDKPLKDNKPLKDDKLLKGDRLLIHRHSAVVRVTHWINALSLLVLLLSGLQILCAHPAFYWGDTARFAHPIAEIAPVTTASGELRGGLTFVGVHLDTTGLLGASKGSDGQMAARAFPSWLTLPAELDLGAGRRWHFFFAWLLVLNGLVYLAEGTVRRRWGADLVPTRAQLSHIGRDILDHVRLRFPKGEAARRYNVLQKLAYLPVVFLALPLMVITGLAMSPAIDARFHLLTEVLGGRQSARTLHFIGVSTLVAFAAVHLIMVVLAGPLNLMRSMITGWMVIDRHEAGK